MAAAVAAVVVAVAVALASGSSGPTESTFRAQLLAVCAQTETQVQAVQAPQTAAGIERFAALASTMVDRLTAIQPPASDATAYRLYLTDVRTELPLLRRLGADVRKGDSADIAALQPQLSTVSATVDRDGRAAGLDSIAGCGSQSQPAATNQGTSTVTVDAAAKELAHTAQIGVETYWTQHSGGYTGVTRQWLNAVEGTIQITPGDDNPYLSRVSATRRTYTLTTHPASGGETFTINRAASGAVTRTCTPSSGVHGGCYNGTW